MHASCRPTQSSAVRAQRCSSISPSSLTLCSLHRHSCQISLASSSRVKFKLAVIVYETAPRYLSDRLSRVADMPSRRRLRSSTFNQLTFCPSRLVTVGERSFDAAGPKLWNSLLDDITSASSLTMFRRKLKTHFGSYIRTLLCSLFVVVLAMVILAVIYVGHLKNCYVM